MSRVITFSRTYPSYHPKAGQPTYFVEKFYRSFSVEACGELFALPITILDLCQWNPELPYGAIEEFHKSLKSWGSFPSERPDIDPKFHTIRAGHRFKAGDYFSPRVWLGAAYRSKQLRIAPDTQIPKTWDFRFTGGAYVLDKRYCDGEIEGHHELLQQLAANDGLSKDDLLAWFKYPEPFDGQIICWNENIVY